MHITINYWKLCFIYCRFLVYLFLKESSPKKNPKNFYQPKLSRRDTASATILFYRVSIQEKSSKWSILNHFGSYHFNHSKPLDKMTGFDWATYLGLPKLTPRVFGSPTSNTPLATRWSPCRIRSSRSVSTWKRQPNGKQVETHHFWDFQRKL